MTASCCVASRTTMTAIRILMDHSSSLCVSPRSSRARRPLRRFFFVSITAPLPSRSRSRQGIDGTPRCHSCSTTATVLSLLCACCRYPLACGDGDRTCTRCSTSAGSRTQTRYASERPPGQPSRPRSRATSGTCCPRSASVACASAPSGSGPSSAGGGCSRDCRAGRASVRRAGFAA